MEEIVTEDTRIEMDDQGSEREIRPARAAAVEKHGSTAPVPVEEKVDESGTGEKGDKVTDTLEEAKKLALENRDRWLRAVADLENLKKRNAQERSKLIKYKNEELLRDLLTISDNLERAISHCDHTTTSSGLMEGLRLVANMLKDTMVRYGVAEIDCLGKPFDPTFHEAIGRVQAGGVAPNMVVEEMEKGYLYHDRLLRPAKVTISA